MCRCCSTEAAAATAGRRSARGACLLLQALECCIAESRERHGTQPSIAPANNSREPTCAAAGLLLCLQADRLPRRRLLTAPVSHVAQEMKGDWRGVGAKRQAVDPGQIAACAPCCQISMQTADQAAQHSTAPTWPLTSTRMPSTSGCFSAGVRLTTALASLTFSTSGTPAGKSVRRPEHWPQPGQH